MTSEPMTPEILDELVDTDPLQLKNEAVYLLVKVQRLTARLAKVCELHSEFRIYEVCAHLDHDDDADLVELDSGQYVCRSGYQHSVCRECCAPGDSQSETCVDEHDHSECWPCPTRLAARGDAVTPAESSSPTEEKG